MKQTNPTSLLGSTLQLTLVSLLSQFLYFLYQVVLSRIVGTEVLGLIHMVMPVYYTFLSFLTSGFALAVSKLSSEYQSQNNHTALGEIVERTTQLFSYLFFLFGLLFLLAYQLFIKQYFTDSPQALFFLIVPLLLFFTAREIFNKHYFYGTDSIRIPSTIQITEQLVRIFFVIALLLIFPQKTPLESVLLILLGMLVSEVYSSLHLTYLRKHQSVAFPFTPCNKVNKTHMSRTILRIALPVSLTAFFCQSISTLNSVIIPSLLVKWGLDQATALQNYGVLFGMTFPLLMVPSSFINALSIVLLPYISRCRVFRQREKILKTLRRIIVAVTLLVIPGTLLIAKFGAPLGLLFYHHPDVGNFILPLAAGVIFSAYEIIVETTLNAFNKQTANAGITLIATFIQIYFTLSYTTSIGLEAFVTGFVLSCAFGCLIRTLLLFRILSHDKTMQTGPATAAAHQTTQDI